MLEKKLKGLCIAVVAILFSCKKNEPRHNDEEFEYRISVEDTQDSINKSELVADYQLIALKTGSGFFLDEIENSVLVDDLVYVQDRYGVYCFDLKGNFKFALDDRGKGPREFVKIRDFCIDEGEIYLFDSAGRKILVYNAHTGNYRRTIDVEYPAKSIGVIGDTLFLDRLNMINPVLADSDHSRLLVTSLSNNENIFYTDFTYEEKNGFNKELMSYHQNAYWRENAYNKVYKWNGSRFKPYVHFDFGKRNITREYVNQLPNGETLFGNTKGKIYDLRQVYENENFIFGRLFIDNDHISTILFDKESSQKLVFKKIGGISEDLFPETFRGVYKDQFYGFISAQTLYFKNKLENEHKISQKVDPKVKDVYKDVKETDNPYLVLYEFKRP